MKLSVALATFNGASHLPSQLASLSTQSRLPDELVVSDDGSTDDTVAIIESFASEAPFEVRILQNSRNLGYAQNFGSALQACTGDLVFLCDQDDIWFNDKIETLCAAAMTNTAIHLFLNDAELTDAEGTPLGLTSRGQTLNLGFSEEKFNLGCCMAVRRELLGIVLPIPEEASAHDTWINRVGVLLDVRAVLPAVKQHYRRHGSNTSHWLTSRTEAQTQLDLVRSYRRADPRGFARERLQELDMLEHRLEQRMTELSGEPAGPAITINAMAEGLRSLRSERDAVQRRIRVLDAPRWYRWLPATAFFASGRYRYFSGAKSYAKDLITK